ncbi:hypothetical protein HOP51_08580 [Halomonas sp. MCCC 1A11036]|uniref:Uncharacterized protein n=1 Tax=Billgrantia zhangzhouensis TaxID=2733481 RepID=A0ABS9AEL0_9GAMM|nr:hypothetical protein [Halomonas zhangzhouensis]MCE8020169.1 hypothetical protein [Halomonas zhangzhouensis]
MQAHINTETRRNIARAYDTLRREQAKAYRLDTTSHIRPDFNRTAIQGNYIFLNQVPGLTKDQHIRLMREAKERIRKRDAEPAAWFYRPDRATWVHARYERGEFKDKSDAELGRAFTGDEEQS